jgi:hypothetical protein
MKTLTEPREIRRFMRQAARRGGRIDGGSISNGKWQCSYSVPAMLIHQVMSMADMEGLSGEDAMTVLAYRALLHLEKCYDERIELLNMTSNPPFVVTTGELKR